MAEYAARKQRAIRKRRSSFRRIAYAGRGKPRRPPASGPVCRSHKYHGPDIGHPGRDGKPDARLSAYQIFDSTFPCPLTRISTTA